MKIAICIYGYLRSWPCYKTVWDDYIAKHGENIDVYIHTWNRSNGVTEGCTPYSAPYPDIEVTPEMIQLDRIKKHCYR